MIQTPLRALLPADLTSPQRARRLLTDWLVRLGCPAETLEDLVFAASEAVTNSVEHAYPAIQRAVITVEATVTIGTGSATRVVITVTDTRRWRPPPTHSGGRGRELSMIEAMVEHLDINSSDTGTHVRITSHPY